MQPGGGRLSGTITTAGLTMRDRLSDTRYRTPGFNSEERDFHATPMIRGRPDGFGSHRAQPKMTRAGDAVACEAYGKHAPGVANVQVTAQLAVTDRVMLLTIASSR